MNTVLIFGLGYSAQRIAALLRAHGFDIAATGSAGNLDFADRDAVIGALGKASHVLSSVPPDRASGVDPVLGAYGAAIASARESGAWIGYLSSTGVYGDQQGAWVDEHCPTVLESGAGRRSARAQADKAWLDLGARVFRLPGIYGPGRSAIERVRAGQARRIDAGDQVFSRIHVDDIARALVAALTNNAPAGAYNIADDEPTSANRVIEYACALLGIEPPPLLTLDEADLSEMARGFYAENRRVANRKAQRVLGWTPRHPSYREGLRALMG